MMMVLLKAHSVEYVWGGEVHLVRVGDTMYPGTEQYSAGVVHDIHVADDGAVVLSDEEGEPIRILVGVPVMVDYRPDIKKGVPPHVEA